MHVHQKIAQKTYQWRCSLSVGLLGLGASGSTITLTTFRSTNFVIIHMYVSEQSKLQQTLILIVKCKPNNSIDTYKALIPC